MNARDLVHLREQVNTAKEKRQRALGRVDQAKSALSALGHEDSDSAQKELTELNRILEELETCLDARLQEFKEKWDM